MRSLPSQRALVLLAFFGATAAWSADPKPFTAPPPLSSDQIARMKEASKSNLNSYGRDSSADTEPFPWMAVTLGVLTLACIAPFAWRAYQSTSSEIRASGPQAPTQRSRTLDD
jgi:hypothetical protein